AAPAAGTAASARAQSQPSGGLRRPPGLLAFLPSCSTLSCGNVSANVVNDHLTEPGGKVRLYVEAPLAYGARVPASESQAHYLLHVMRARAGGRLSLFNGRDGEWLAKIFEVTKRGCVLECEAQMRPQAGTPDLWLCFAPIKKTPADYLTQKATELGVSVLQPVITRR